MTTVAEYEATLHDHAALADMLNKKTFGDWLKGYVNTKTSESGGAELETLVKEQAQKVLIDMMKDNGVTNVQRLNLSPDKGFHGTQAKRNKLYNVKAPGALIDKDYEDSAGFFQTIWHHNNTLPDADQMKAKQQDWNKLRNSFGSTVPADGGFLIPETLRSELLSVALETAIVRPRARIIPMDSLRVPIPMVDSSSNASSIFGGIVAYWTEEGASLTETQASFGRVVLEAKKLTAYSEAPNELVADAPAFGAFLDQILPEAIAWYEDLAFLTGSGVGEPLGIFNGTAAVTVPKEVGQAAATIVWENIVKMFSRMLPASLGRAVWIAGIDTFPELATMALNVGTGGSAIWLNNGVEGPPMTILGRPVIFTEKSPLLGAAGDISFVDFGYYLIGDRQVMQASSSPHFKFASDKTAYRIIERVDGRPWLETAITPKNTGPTLSPIVKLGAR
jgi:HK97 family phage major capsid protein